MTNPRVTILAGLALATMLGSSTVALAQPAAGPVIVMETSKGTIEFETYPEDAPKTVAHIVGLVKKGFYTGLRFHRVIPGFVIQVGDPQTRDMSKKETWGRGSASVAIGVAEFSKKRRHVKGAVAMGHAGDAAKASSHIYFTLANRYELDGKYTVFGKVIAGLPVTEKIQIGDTIKKMYVRATAAPKP